MKNYSKMSETKLRNLLTIAEPAEAELIQAELNSREEKRKADEAPAEVSEAPAEVSEAAEVSETTEAPAEVPETTEAKPKKMTDEERTKLASELKETIVGRKCQVVPFNTPCWVNGVIVAIVEDKRNNKVMCAIKTDEGKRLIKVYGSNGLKILDEKVEIVKTRGGRTSGTRQNPESRNEDGTWDREADFMKFVGNVGKIIKFLPFRSEGNGQAEMIEGRITGLVPDGRVSRYLYRVVYKNGEETKTVHKVTTSSGFEIAEEFDEVGKEMNDKCLERHGKIAERTPLLPADRVVACEEALKKAQDALEKARARVKAAEAALKKAQEELQASEAEVQEAEVQAPETEEDPLL